MSRLLRVVVLAVAFALITVACPWWSVALLALACGWLGSAAQPIDVGLGAALGWATLLGVAALQGPVAVLAGRLGGLFHAPPAVLLAVTVLYAGVLGWSGAGLGRAARGQR
ncbi:MAG: hypothetical protein ACHQ2E_03315 [Gemmatimonadales bacterium]